MQLYLIYLIFILLVLGGVSKILLHIAPRIWIMDIKNKSSDVTELFKGRPPHKKWLNKFGMLLWYVFYGCIIMLFMILLLMYTPGYQY